MVEFYSLKLDLPKGWFDITKEVGNRTIPTLAKNNGIGALQFSIARYSQGSKPNIRKKDLVEMINNKSELNSLGIKDVKDCKIRNGIGISGNCITPTEYFMLWYITNSIDLVLITYIALVSNSTDKSDVKNEISDVKKIIQTIII